MTAAVLASLLALAPAGDGRCAVDDLMPGWDRFAAATATLPPDARAAAFLGDYAPSHPGFYLIGTTRSLDELRTPALAYFAGGTPRPGLRPFSEAALAATEQAVDRLFPIAEARFAAALPDFQCRTRIVFGVSLGRFDGTLVPGDPPRLLFGLDTISRLHGPDTLPALFHHELFHLYQAEVNPAGARIDPIPLWWGMWQEGLATWFSGQLNPDLPPAKLFWLPLDLIPRAEAQHRAIAAAMLASLDASGPAYDRFFVANEAGGTMPPRAGYYLGYLLAREMGETHTAAELARMPPDQVRTAVQAFLTREAARP